MWPAYPPTSEPLPGKRVACLAADVVEDVEYTQSRAAAEQAGAEVHLISLKSGEIQSMNQDINPANHYRVDRERGQCGRLRRPVAAGRDGQPRPAPEEPAGDGLRPGVLPATNQPRGFDLVSGEVTDVRPWEAMFNPATPPQTVHMIVAAFMVTGFGIASVYAVALLRGRRDRYHRLGFAIPFTVAAVLSPVQVVVGDWAAHFVGEYQPTKLAAMEGLARTQAGAPLSLGGVYVDGELRYAVEVPNALSLLAKWDPDAVVVGLDQVPDDQEPPVTVVKWAFQLMVAIGFGLVALSGWWALAWWRRRGPPRSPWFLRVAALAGIAAAVAVEAGWVVTEVGRQPWIVYGVMRTAEAVNPAPGLATGLALVAAVYAMLTVATVAVLWRMARHRDEPVAPQEGVPEPVDSGR